MVNNPLTTQDINYVPLSFDDKELLKKWIGIEGKPMVYLEKVQSAKRFYWNNLQLWAFNKDLSPNEMSVLRKMLDACFQIPDGDDDK